MTARLKKYRGFWSLRPCLFSGTTVGENGINPSEPMTLETVDRFAREIGFKGRYQLNLPKGEEGQRLGFQTASIL